MVSKDKNIEIISSEITIPLQCNLSIVTHVSLLGKLETAALYLYKAVCKEFTDNNEQKLLAVELEQSEDKKQYTLTITEQ